MLVLLKSVSMAKRLGILCALVCGIGFIAVTVPGAALARLATITGALSTDVGPGASEASDSVAERRELQEDALRMLASHPLFGVGPGQYMNFRHDTLVENGVHKKYFPAHNTYLQIGAESGAIGLLLYLAFLWNIHSALRRVRKINLPDSHPDWQLVERITLCLELSFVFFCVCSTFLNCDHYPHIFVVGGLAVALERLTRAAVAKASIVAVLEPLPQPSGVRIRKVQRLTVPRVRVPGIV